MSKTPIQLSDHFTCRKLICFTLPSITMIIFTAIYGVVDGFFVSNYAGKTPFAAVNLIIPLLLILGSVGFMFGTGGGALIAKTMGQGDRQRANNIFSLIVYASAACGVVLAALGFLILRPAAVLMGAEGELLEQALIYGRINLIALPFYVLQYEFQCLFATAEKPRLGLFVTVAAGVANMVLDALFVGVFSWGAAGAAAATAISQCIGGVAPLIYFARPNSSLLRLTKTRPEGTVLLKACANGSSELMTNLSMSLVNILYNYQLLRFAGEDGVAAYGVIMYASFLFVAVFVGYAVGSAPIVSFHYGARNHAEVHNLYSKSLRLIGVVAVVMTGISMVFIPYVSRIFVGYDASLLALTNRAFRLYALSFLIMGFNVYASSFFTALGDGVTSALISFLRTLLFQLLALIFLPMVLGIEGVWLAVTAAEAGALCVTVLMFITKDKVFHYRKASC